MLQPDVGIKDGDGEGELLRLIAVQIPGCLVMPKEVPLMDR